MGGHLCSLLVSFGVSTRLPQIMRSAGYSLGAAVMGFLPRRGPLTRAEADAEVDLIAAH